MRQWVGAFLVLGFFAASAVAQDADMGQRLRSAIAQCWNVAPGAVEAVTVGFDLDEQGRVLGDTRLVGGSGGTESEIDTAYQAARRAILRCQGDGYNLPVAEYEIWRTVQINFDPNMLNKR